jgi:phosphatidylglycerol lysyltransferase
MTAHPLHVHAGVIAFAMFVSLALGLMLVQRPAAVATLLRAGGNVTTELVPRLFAVMTFLAGTVLLFSGATPARTGRMGWITGIVPLPLIELSAYIVSIGGVALILLAHGIRRRLDAAYHLTIWVLAGGAVFALTSAFDVEQAVLLAALCAALIPCRGYFYRRSSLFEERFTYRWFVAVGGVLTATAALALLGYGRAIVGSQVFWQFGGDAQAPRAARALTVAIVALLVVSLARLLRPSHARRVAVAVDPARIEKIVRESPAANAHLALLGDKAFLVNESGTAFVMFGMSGNSMIAMGDPVGPVRESAELVSTFIEQCYREGAWPAFYRVGPQLLYRYLDHGLSAVKLGEVARVTLHDFSLDGSQRRNLRRVWRKLVDAGCTFEIVPFARVPETLDTLRPISDEWLAQKRVREKGFSLGVFQDSFVSAGPVAVVRRNGRVIAFATLWLSGRKAEIEVDLMRYTEDAPPGVMRYLLVEAMSWAKQQGFAEFNLGMVPLAGIQGGQHSPMWNQIVHAVRLGGERYYNFQGLREFKAWFYPEWEPNYLASAGGARRPLIVTNIASLIAGSAGGVVRR